MNIKKLHLLLVESSQTEIEFFTDALEESGLMYLCTLAKSSNATYKILKNTTPDVIFISNNIVQNESKNLLKKIKEIYPAPVIVYSTIKSMSLNNSNQTFNYVQLPNNIFTMGHILKNLFIENTVPSDQSAHVY